MKVYYSILITWEVGLKGKIQQRVSFKVETTKQFEKRLDAEGPLGTMMLGRCEDWCFRKRDYLLIFKGCHRINEAQE